MKIGINFQKALEDHNKSLEKIVKKFGVEKYTQIDKKTAKLIRNDFVIFLENYWTKYIEISNL